MVYARTLSLSRLLVIRLVLCMQCFLSIILRPLSCSVPNFRLVCSVFYSYHREASLLLLIPVSTAVLPGQVLQMSVKMGLDWGWPHVLLMSLS